MTIVIWQLSTVIWQLWYDNCDITIVIWQLWYDNCDITIVNGDITIVIWQLWYDNCDMTIVISQLSTVISQLSCGSEAGRAERWYILAILKHFEYEFQDIFPMLYGAAVRHIQNEILKCPNANQNGVFNISSWYKFRLTFTAWRL